MPDIEDLYTAAPTTAVRVGGQEFVAGELVRELIDPRDTPEERERRLTQRTYSEGPARYFVKGEHRDPSLSAKNIRDEKFRAKRQAARATQRELQQTPLAERDTPKGHYESWRIEWQRKVRETADDAQAIQNKQQQFDKLMSDSRGGQKTSEIWLDGWREGTEITPENFKEEAFEMGFNPAMLGEHNYTNIVEAILYGDANWIPKNEALSADNIPSWWITTNPDQFRPLLQRIDREDDPVMKQRANYLHDLVEADSDKYVATHPTQGFNAAEMATHLAGTHGQLSDDWSVPWKKGVNSVMFNNQLHSQIDAGVIETY